VVCSFLAVQYGDFIPVVEDPPDNNLEEIRRAFIIDPNMVLLFNGRVRVSTISSKRKEKA